MSILKSFVESYEKEKEVEMSMEDYLDLCKKDPFTYATPAERLLKAIGDPVLVDTSKDPRLSRIYQNRTIKIYPTFSEFFGMETVIEDIVKFFICAAQGLEERKQVFYLLGPVGGGKSSLAERIKDLMEVHPIYVLKAGKDISPVFESPLGLFDAVKNEKILKHYNIPDSVVKPIMSPWAVKRLDEFDIDFTKFTVVKLYPSKLRQRAIAKTEPGDDNNQDISSLVGKTDLRRLDELSQNDPDAYSFSGALCNTNQGILEFVEMFKAPIKTLHPLLTATQEGNYVGSEEIGPIPFTGIIMAHSNESEWKNFKAEKANEAFLDRIYLIQVPYCLRYKEEAEIYKKLLRDSTLKDADCAPKTLEMLSQFSVLTRLKEHPNSNEFTKMKIYNGENLKDSDPRAKSIQEYLDKAGVDEGMSGISTRFAFKVLSKTFNYDPDEIAADPIHLMVVLKDAIKSEQFDLDKESELIDYIDGLLLPKYVDEIGKEIQRAYLESYSDYGQNIFDRYVEYADHWIQDQDFKDFETGQMISRARLDSELEKLEKPADVQNAKAFRNDIVQFVLRAKAKNNGKMPKWNSYNKMKEVIEKKMFASTEELLPIISFESKKTKTEAKKHTEFVKRMVANGYTERQTKRVVDFHMRHAKSL